MATLSGREFHVRVVSRRLVKASDTSIQPRGVLSFSNLDLLAQSMQISVVCIYATPPTSGFNAVVAAFVAGLPCFLNHFFPFAGRIATNPSSGLPELHCNNRGAELVVGEADVALASLDDGNMSASVRKVVQTYSQDVALSVQLVSFACGGFTVAWCTNHVLIDGTALSSLISSWPELVRSGTLPEGARPNHDRSVIRPRPRPVAGRSHSGASLGFAALHDEHQVNVLTTEASFAERLYYVVASDIARLREAASRDGCERASRVQSVSAYLWKALAGVVSSTAEPRCRMAWWVDGRSRFRSPELRAVMRNYVGNVTTSTVREVAVDKVRRMELPDVAAMVREAIAAPEYDEHFQELVDWAEEHKTGRYVETTSLGLGSPAVSVTAMCAVPVDTDFGFGRAAAVIPWTTPTARLCGGYVLIAANPADDGSWIVHAILWPRLVAALESDEPRVFRPVTAEYLGLLPRKPASSSKL